MKATANSPLHVVIQELAQAFAHAVVAAVAESAFDSSATRPISPKPQRASRERANPQQGPLGELVKALRTQPRGLRAEELRGRLGLEKAVLTKALKQGLASGDLTKEGQLRATRYFAAP